MRIKRLPNCTGSTHPSKPKEETNKLGLLNPCDSTGRRYWSNPSRSAPFLKPGRLRVQTSSEARERLGHASKSTTRKFYPVKAVRITPLVIEKD
jgi:hypothetical protein